MKLAVGKQRSLSIAKTRGWSSGKCVRRCCSRFGFDFESGQINEFKNWFSHLPSVTLSITEQISVENKPESLLVLSLEKALNGIPPSWSGRQMAGNS